MIKTYVSDDSVDGLDTDGVIEAGDTVTFSLTVENQGDVAAFDIDVTDYIGTAFTAVTLAAGGPGGVTDNGDETFTIDTLAVDGSVTFEVEAVSSGTAAAGDTLTNWAEITDGSATDGGATAVDIDSTPDGTNFNQPGETDDLDDDDVTDEDGKNGGDEDDHDPASVTILEEFDLALIKEYVSDDSADGLDTDGVIEDGDTVTFSLTVENQGDVAAFDIDVTDYIGTAFVNPALGAVPATTAPRCCRERRRQHRWHVHGRCSRCERSPQV